MTFELGHFYPSVQYALPMVKNGQSDPETLYIASGTKAIKLFSISMQLSMKFSLLINMKMPTIVGIFIFISREIFMLSYV